MHSTSKSFTLHIAFSQVLFVTMAIMRFLSIFALALTALSECASGAGVTNLEVTAGLNAFNAKLQAQSDNLSAFKESIEAQKKQIISIDAKISELQEAFELSMEMVCDAESCPRRQNPIAPIEVSPTTPAPELVGCPIGDTFSRPMLWNEALCGPYNPSRAGPECFVARHNKADMEACLKALHDEAEKGLVGCFDKTVGTCTCNIDYSRESNFAAGWEEAMAGLKSMSSNFASHETQWYGGAFHNPDGSLSHFSQYKVYAKYNCALIQ